MKEDIYYYCTSCGHVHLRNSEIGKLHYGLSFKTQKEIKQMNESEKGIENIGDVKLKKRPFFRSKTKKRQN
jgi:hypothetical protein